MNSGRAGRVMCVARKGTGGGPGDRVGCAVEVLGKGGTGGDGAVAWEGFRGFRRAFVEQAEAVDSRRSRRRRRGVRHPNYCADSIINVPPGT